LQLFFCIFALFANHVDEGRKGDGVNINEYENDDVIDQMSMMETKGMFSHEPMSVSYAGGRKLHPHKR
jgi:hypothetical protein